MATRLQRPATPITTTVGRTDGSSPGNTVYHLIAIPSYRVSLPTTGAAHANNSSVCTSLHASLDSPRPFKYRSCAALWWSLRLAARTPYNQEKRCGRERTRFIYRGGLSLPVELAFTILASNAFLPPPTISTLRTPDQSI